MQHYKGRMCIIRHMRHISYIFYESHVGNDIAKYIDRDKKMDQLSSYGSTHGCMCHMHGCMDGDVRLE